MNKHTEAIEALRSLSPSFLFESLKKSSSLDTTPLILNTTFGALREAQRILEEWDEKIMNPPYIKRLRCKTCGIPTYYENLNGDERCPACEDEMRIYLATAVEDEEEREEEKKETRKRERSNKAMRSLAFQITALPSNERLVFMSSLSPIDKVLVKSIIKKELT